MKLFFLISFQIVKIILRHELLCHEILTSGLDVSCKFRILALQPCKSIEDTVVPPRRLGVLKHRSILPRAERFPSEPQLQLAKSLIIMQLNFHILGAFAKF